jgi:hypothetical protein
LIGYLAVSRPLFIEEHGLRLLLTKEGVGVELSRQSYEAGDWAAVVEEAWERGKDAKAKKRADMAAGRGVDQRQIEGRKIAITVIDWTLDWWGHDVRLDNGIE